MALLTAAELRRIERKHEAGIKSADCVEIFRSRGERFSEPTLRKYVQLGLLPRSRRVGTRGRHKGSSGLYPVTIVRQINEIKQALDDGATLEEIRISKVGLAGEVEALERAAEEVFKRFAEALSLQDRKKRGPVKKAFDKQKRALQREMRGLGRLATRIGGMTVESFRA